MSKIIKDQMFISRCIPVGTNSFVCQCLSGYTGTNCETNTASKREAFIFPENKTASL